MYKFKLNFEKLKEAQRNFDEILLEKDSKILNLTEKIEEGYFNENTETKFGQLLYDNEILKEKIFQNEAEIENFKKFEENFNLTNTKNVEKINNLYSENEELIKNIEDKEERFNLLNKEIYSCYYFNSDKQL